MTHGLHFYFPVKHVEDRGSLEAVSAVHVKDTIAAIAFSLDDVTEACHSSEGFVFLQKAEFFICGAQLHSIGQKARVNIRRVKEGDANILFFDFRRLYMLFATALHK